MTSEWPVRYADLAGKTMIVASESSVVVEITRTLATNGALLAIVVPDRGVLDQCLAITEELDVASFGVHGDPSNPQLWERIGQHIEQRLGPIDVVVVAAAAATRNVVAAALLPDMVARQRGVLIEIGTKIPYRPAKSGVRHRAIQGAYDPAPQDLAAAAAFCASDTMTAQALLVSIA
jgi:NAD(P)-dependent dehydrogenase (short-subunit alcohol dehydrogenase family)